LTNDLEALPLPTSGYDVYLVGELHHGTREVASLTLSCLETLHEATGLRDLVLEGGPGFESDINDYVLGLNDAPSDLWYPGRMEILAGVRAPNQTLAHEEKIRVHLVDVHGRLSTSHTYLQELRKQMGTVAEDIPLPSLSEFETWNEEEILALVDQLTEAAQGDDRLLNELATVRASIRFHFAWEGFERGKTSATVGQEIREEAIANNVRHLLTELEGAPVLAMYGGWHAQEVQGMRTVKIYGRSVVLDVQPWAQRLVKSGVAVYSLLAGGTSGQARLADRIIPADADPGQLRFGDGTTLATVWDAASDYSVVYLDLRANSNASARFGTGFARQLGIFDEDTPASEIHDGIVLFREVTPVQW
jgi:hypothetical protein